MLTKQLNLPLYADFYPKYVRDKFSPLLTPTANPLELYLPIFPPLITPDPDAPHSAAADIALTDHLLSALYCDQKRLLTHYPNVGSSLEALHAQFSIRVQNLQQPLKVFAQLLLTNGFCPYGLQPAPDQHPIRPTVHTHWLHLPTNAVAITHIHPHFLPHKNSFSVSLHFPDASRVYYLPSNWIDETLPTTIYTTIEALMEELSDWQLNLLTC